MSNNEIFNMYFGIIEDPRCQVNVIHKLIDILKLVEDKITKLNIIKKNNILIMDRGFVDIDD